MHGRIYIPLQMFFLLFLKICLLKLKTRGYFTILGYSSPSYPCSNLSPSLDQNMSPSPRTPAQMDHNSIWIDPIQFCFVFKTHLTLSSTSLVHIIAEAIPKAESTLQMQGFLFRWSCSCAFIWNVQKRTIWKKLGLNTIISLNFYFPPTWLILKWDCGYQWAPLD